MKLADFIKQHGLTFRYERVDHNPHMAADQHWRADHWKCKVVQGRRSFEVYYSKGEGHNGEPPTIEEVLDCIASDVAGLANARSFEDWCREYGYDTDSRGAEKTFKQIQYQEKQLRRLLGDAAETLLWKVERE